MLGNTDKPIERQKDDTFGIERYVNGLSTFILNSDTPMTISIQGDWGSGKTSMMNMIQEKISRDTYIIWFNTWQFSQFELQNELTLSKPEMNTSVYGFTSWKHVREGWNIEEFAETTYGLSIKEIAQTDWNVEESVSTFPLAYILHGDDDHACDVLNSQVLADALKNAGIPHVLELGKGTDHGFGEGYFTPLRGWIERAVNYYEESVK